MEFSFGPLGLYTDFYELAMAQGYFYSGKKNENAVFDYFFRTNPYKGGYTVFAGLYDLLRLLKDFRYSDSDLNYLQEQGFKSGFLDYLKDFSFTGDIFSVAEGEIVFPNEPVARIEGNIIETQLVESFLLNILNFESLIATKAFRIKQVSGGKSVSDFGMRRAQGLGSLLASRAACIGGVEYTSNVLAGKMYGIPVSGTMAHSWVQSFANEFEAFKTFAENNPENTILLADTYDTLNSGIPNAIKVAELMKISGHRLKGIRLDSGDLAYLSKKARGMLDNAGLHEVKIFVSNQLNEFVIKSLVSEQNAPIDAFGVGTEMVTGKPDASLDGVYKLASVNGLPKMKISENVEKITLPGLKNLYRYFDGEGNFFRDGILLSGENPETVNTLFHPVYPEKFTVVKNLRHELLTRKVFSKGSILIEDKKPAEIYRDLEQRSRFLPEEHRRFISPHLYKVGVSEQLSVLKKKLMGDLKNNL